VIGLQQSRDPASGGDWIRIGTSRAGFERIDVSFRTLGFTPHRHDTYAVGVTVRGVQSFAYRGTTEHCVAGRAFVLHPDELHDGRAGAAGGFGYRILYIEPRLVQAALGGAGHYLPFVRDAVTDDSRMCAAIEAALEDIDIAIEDLQFDEALVRLAHALAAGDGSVRAAAPGPANVRAAQVARDYLDARVEHVIRSDALERLTGVTRFELARHFRACFGTSPHRYVVMRRVDRARALMRAGKSLTRAAVESGFADQSHMTRHFKKAYGLSPGRWRALERAAVKWDRQLPAGS
jgi:AraC-like DNA-binding protein